MKARKQEEVQDESCGYFTFQPQALVQSLLSAPCRDCYCCTSQDRDYGSTIFRQCFVGSQAVDWMCDMGISGSREEAVAIGQRLVEFGLVDHVNSVFRYVRLHLV